MWEDTCAHMHTGMWIIYKLIQEVKEPLTAQLSQPMKWSANMGDKNTCLASI